jgi:hypothetical protein
VSFFAETCTTTIPEEILTKDEIIFFCEKESYAPFITSELHRNEHQKKAPF